MTPTSLADGLRTAHTPLLSVPRQAAAHSRDAVRDLWFAA
jgi:hypothetical protein